MRMPYWHKKPIAEQPTSSAPLRNHAESLRAVLSSAMEHPEPVHFPIRPPQIMRGVVPEGKKPQVAMDSAAYEAARMAYDAAPRFSNNLYTYGNIEGFPGYPYLMLLALRVEYRNMANALANELTREWIEFTSKETSGESTKARISIIEKEFERLGIKNVFKLAATHDAFYGTGQILINIDGAKWNDPLIVDKRTIKKGTNVTFRNCEPIWTTPLMYNALIPSEPDFYRPSSWWVMGERWDATRMIIINTRPVPDIYKPAFNFSGISLSQLVEPYVNNWLRARQSVSDLLNNFSIVVLKTAMDQVLTGSADGNSLMDRIKLFTTMRSNKGVMVLDNSSEELQQIAVPLGGLHELQAQAQEQMCSASREPSVVMTGISPSGFGNVAEGEIRIWYDWIRAQQESHYRGPLERILKIVQLAKFGDIDTDISFEFRPLYQMTEEQMSVVRNNDSIRAGNYIDRGVIDAQEERERLARDPKSGYQGLDVDKQIEPPNPVEMEAPLGRGNA